MIRTRKCAALRVSCGTGDEASVLAARVGPEGGTASSTLGGVAGRVRRPLPQSGFVSVRRR